jgi:hypothetical protein
MKQLPLTHRWIISKLWMIWTLGLAVLFGSPGISLAQRPPIPVATYCGCTCWYSGPGGKTQSKGVTFTSDKSCSVHSDRTCYCDDQTCYLEYKTGSRYKGALYDCKRTLPLKQLESPTGQRGVTPPGGTLLKSP